MKVWMRGRCRVLDRPPGGVDVGLVGAGQAADHRALDVAGDRLDRLEVAGRGDREAGLDHVDPQARQLLGDLDLLAGVQRDAGRLLAVAQCRVEDVDAVCVVCWCHWVLLLLCFVSNDLVSRGYRAAQRYSPRRGRRRRSARLSGRCVIRSPQLSVGCAHRKRGFLKHDPPLDLVRPLRDGHRRGGDRQRLLRDQRRPADDGEGLRHQHQHDPVGGQRLRADLRRDDRHRRAAGRHVRAAQRLLPRHRDLRLDVGPGRGGADRDLADRDADADGDRRGADVAGDPRHDLRAAARRQGGPGRRDHHRRGRASATRSAR